jgi:hypothetical protein
MRALLFVFAIMACGGALSSRDKQRRLQLVRSDNRQRAEAAFARWATSHTDLHELPASPLAAQQAQEGAANVNGEAIARDAASGHLLVHAGQCVESAPCECPLMMNHRFFVEPSGRVVVLRARPQMQIQRVHVEQCTGCGVEPRQPVQPWIDLGVSEPDQISVIDVDYLHVQLEEVCDHPSMVP